jgi:hypothetical protein
MSFSLVVIILMLGFCTLMDFCAVWGLLWTDLKVAHKEKEQFESPPTLSPLLLLRYKIIERTPYRKLPLSYSIPGVPLAPLSEHC